MPLRGIYIKKLINEINFNSIFHKILFFHLLSQNFLLTDFTAMHVMGNQVRNIAFNFIFTSIVLKSANHKEINTSTCFKHVIKQAN